MVTQRKNTQDAVDRGLIDYQTEKYRSTRKSAGAAASRHHGTSNDHARWTNEEVAQMRALYQQGVSQVKIAAMFGTRKQKVWNIVHFKTYRLD